MLKDLQDFMVKLQEDKILQDKMNEIMQASTPENVFDNCNAVAAEMGYTITEDDLQACADEYQMKTKLDDYELDMISGGATSKANLGTNMLLNGVEGLFRLVKGTIVRKGNVI